MTSKKSFRTVEISNPIPLLPGLKFITIKSKALRMRVDLTVFLPVTKFSPRKLPLVILLHGVYGSHWAWSFKGNAHAPLQRLVDRQEIPPMALAMPSDGLWGDGSGYIPHRTQNFESWIVDEVPRVVEETLGVSTLHRKNFITGLSMGGFGAMRLGALYSDRFAAFSGHSSITDFRQMKEFVEEPMGRYQCSAKKSSLYRLILENQKRIGPFRFDCGVDDPLIRYNRELHLQLDQNGIAHGYQEFLGTHEWKYWEIHLEDSLRFFAQHLHLI